MELIKEFQENCIGERIPGYIEIESTEDWRIVEGFPKYVVTDRGRVINIKTGKVLKPSKQTRKNWITYSRYVVKLCSDFGKAKNCYVHKLVARAFLPIPTTNPDGSALTGMLTVNHKDYNTFNNNVSNLEWTDISYNSRHQRSFSKYSLSIFMSLEELIEKRKAFEYRSPGYKAVSSMIYRKRKALKN